MTIAYDRVGLLLTVAEKVAGHPALKPIADAAMIELADSVKEASDLIAQAAAAKKAAEDKAAADKAAKDKTDAEAVAAQEKAMADARAKSALDPLPAAQSNLGPLPPFPTRAPLPGDA